MNGTGGGIRTVVLTFATTVALAAGIGCGTDQGGAQDGWEVDPGKDLPVQKDVTGQLDTSVDPGPSDPGGPSQDVFDVQNDTPPQDLPKDTPSDTPDDVQNTCQPPQFSDNCLEVEQFQCGFFGECVDGTLFVDWHHHWFCDGWEIEEIIDFQCTYDCPYGCLESEYMNWPADGKQLVAENCRECMTAEHCKDKEIDLDACDGHWECKDGSCIWICNDIPCVPEGGSIPLIPDAPECCEGLVQIPCDSPDEYGFCQWCSGAAFCAKCGNEICGPAENLCNCPKDCGEPCVAPSFPLNCAEVDQFQCGFMAECKAGELHADWHHHWMCNGIEEITDYECWYQCPNGCKEGYIDGWPSSGKELVTDHCIQCVKPDDCEKLGLPHDDCEGHWECLEGQCNWVCDTPCLGLGQGFVDFETEGKCCEGLKPMSDCDLMDGGCSCPKCPCYVCLPCGDKVCGPFEHKCNCEEDCPEEQKCIPTKQSECSGSPPGDKPEGVLKLGVDGHDLSIVHSGVTLNCCHEFEICYTPKMGELVVTEKIVQPAAPCFCMCDFDLSGTIKGIKSGTWAFTLYNEELDKILFTEEVVIP